MTPKVLITRPEAQGQAFAAKLREACEGPMDIIVSPLLRIAPIAVDLPQCEAMILTSVNGVAQAVRLGVATGTMAFCVGPKTADAARDAGFKPVTGPGDAEGLIGVLRDHRPQGRVVHIRGEHARGDIAKALMQDGLDCAEVVAYRQEQMSLDAAARRALDDVDPVVIPIFSPRTATLLAAAGPFRAALHIVAISEAAVPDVAGAEATIAACPDGNAMLDATIACLAALSKDVT